MTEAVVRRVDSVGGEGARRRATGREALASAVGLLLLAVLSLPPLLAGGQRDWASGHSSATAALAARAAVLLGMLAFIGWAARPTGATLAVAALAAALALGHRLGIDERPDAAAFQRTVYRQILRLGPGPAEECVPHAYRPLSYGFVRTLELATGDWPFACLAYRWFFQFWFLWGAYRLAALYVSPAAALAAPVVCAVYYPLSVLRYAGQLTDPVSHALFAWGLVWIVQDRRGLLLAALVLGMLAKETAVLLVPAYWACHRREGTRTVLWSVAFLVVCTAAFLAPRWPLGWRPGASLNGVEGTLLLSANFAPREMDARTSVPLAEHWLHPLAFVVPFVPLAAWGWRQTPPSLRALALTVVPLMIGVHVTMSWSYESRNYMPALPVLAALAVHTFARKEQPPGARQQPGA
jgi:hypothetical protein